MSIIGAYCSKIIVSIILVRYFHGTPAKVQKPARKFLKEFHLRTMPTCSALEQILKSQNFVTVYFDPDNISEYVQDLIDMLNLHDEIQKLKGFTYCNKDLKFVFVNQKQDDEERLYILLHEEAHIYLKHLDDQNGVCNMSTSQENEARNLTFWIREESQISKANRILRIAAPTASALILVVALTLWACLSGIFEPTDDTALPAGQTGLLASDSTSDAEPSTYTYYWTNSGTVYHMYADCQHLKNSASVQSGSKSLSGKDRCCKTCYAHYLKETYGDSSE